MVGNYATYRPDRDIFDEVKVSLKDYIGDLQSGSMVYIIPFGNEIDPARIRQFGIDEPSAPDGGLADALDYIDSLQADNDETHITESITYSLGMLDGLRDDDRQHIQTMLLFTDGYGNGPGDTDENDDFIVDNLLDAINDYRREQPYLFVKYVSLGVDVPNAEVLVENNVDVLNQAEGVPPVREVRLAIVPNHLDGLEPGVAATNLLCATSGNLGVGGLTIEVNDNPTGLPVDVQVAFRSEGNQLTEDGLPLQYTVANYPASGEGPYTTQIEVRADDPEVFLIPNRLPVTFSLADPTPAGTLTFGAFPPGVFTRVVDTADISFDLPVTLAAPDGGAAELAIDTDAITAMFPGATAEFVAGTRGLGKSITLDSEQPATHLRVTAPAAEINALSGDAYTLEASVTVRPQNADLTISGATSTPQGDGAFLVVLGTTLEVRPQPVCAVDVAPAPEQLLMEGGAEGGNDPRWKATVTLRGSNGCAGLLTLDDSTLQQSIPGASASFEVNGETALQVDLTDEPSRVNIVATAPLESTLALGTGDHELAVDLVASVGAAALSPPDGLAPDAQGDYIIAVPLPLTVSARPGAICQTPAFESQELVADGAVDPALTWSGELSCSFVGDAAVTIRVAAEDAGVSATLRRGETPPGRSLTLSPEEPTAILELQVDRSTAQREGTGAVTFSAQIEARTESPQATVELDGLNSDDGSGVLSAATANVRVLGEKVISLAPFVLSPEPLAVTTMDTEPAMLEWRAELDIKTSNGADGALTIELSPDSPVAAYFDVGGTRVPSPLSLAGQSAPVALVVQMPLEAAAGQGAGAHAFEVPLALDPQGATVEAPDFARVGDLYRDAATVSLEVTVPPTAAITSPVFSATEVSSTDERDDPALIESEPIAYEMNDGANVRMQIDDEALQRAHPAASAEFVVDGEPAGAAVSLNENDEDVRIQIVLPRDAFTEEGPVDIPPVGFTAQGEGAVVILDGEPTHVGDPATGVATPAVTFTIPNFTLDLGVWKPDMQHVPINGSGASDLTWERTLTVSSLESGARPSVVLSAEDPNIIARLFDGAVADDTLLAEGYPGQPAEAMLEPGQETIVAVVSAPEEYLRGLGIADARQIPVTLTVDPHGSEGAIVGGPEAIREPYSDSLPVTARIYQPFDPLPYIRGIGLALLAILAVLAMWFLRPGLPNDAAVEVDGSGSIPLDTGKTLGASGSDIQVGSNGPFGEIRGRWGGRVSGAATFKADTQVEYDGKQINAGKSTKITPGGVLTETDGTAQVTYVRDSGAAQLGADGNGDGGNNV